jgi:hypothetical protein
MDCGRGEGNDCPCFVASRRRQVGTTLLRIRDRVVVLALAGTINAFLGPSQSGPETPQPQTISVERSADECAELMPGVTFVRYANGASQTSANVRANRHARAQPHAHTSPAPAITISLNVKLDRNGIRTEGVLILAPAKIPWQRFALVVTAIIVGPWLPFALYLAVLVALTTQSVGLLVMDLRILDGRLRRAPLWRIIVRYLSVALLWWLILPLSFFSASCMLHDRLSGTRVVPREQLLAREG